MGMNEEADKRFAALIRERCSSGDYEANGCELDNIMLKLLHELKMPETIEAFNAVDCWRA